MQAKTVLFPEAILAAALLVALLFQTAPRFF